jgi:hypothetical protein
MEYTEERDSHSHAPAGRRFLRPHLHSATGACERLAGVEPAIFGLASRRSVLLSYNRMEPARGIEPRPPPYRGGMLTVATKQASRTLGGTRTRNHTALDRARLPTCGTSAREPPPGADPGQPPYEGGAAAVRGGKAALHGFEPRPAASGAAVLPLDQRASSAEGAIRTHRPRGLSSRGLPVAVTPAYAASGSNGDRPE